MPIINNGTLAVTKGSLTTNVGGGGTGTYALSSGTKFNVSNGTVDMTGATLTGAGTLNLNGGGALKGLPGGASNIVFNGGSLVGAGLARCRPPSASITSSGVSVLEGTTWVNNGTVTSNNGTVALYDGSTVTNSGTWTFKNPSADPIFSNGAVGNAVTTRPPVRSTSRRPWPPTPRP